MSVFRNIKVADLWLTDPDGPIIHLRENEEFTGSNYFKIWTGEGAETPDTVYLEIIEDDGTPYQVSTASVPNLLRSWEFAVVPGEDWSDHTYTFTDSTSLGNEATFMQILVDDAAVEVRINGDTESDFRMDPDSTQVFNEGELLVATVAFKNPTLSGGLTANIRLMAAAVAG